MSAEREAPESKAESAVRRGVMERHFHSVLLSVITACVVASGTFVVATREDGVRVATQMVALTSEVSAMRAEIAALRSAYVSREEYRDLKERVTSLEHVVRDGARYRARP
jgi:hypothetical protein